MAKYDVSFKVGADGADEVLEQLKNIQKYLNKLSGSDNKVSISPDVDTSGVDKMSTKIKGVQEQASTLSSTLSGLGTAFSTAGNALQSIGSFFGADTVGTVTRTLTAYATVLASNGFAKSIDRFDTMTTFPKMMAMMGYNADDATVAVNTLNEAVQGLPTSLSDIVEQAQNFTTITGDLEKGVKYAIAANNTFLAGGADTSQVYYGTKQLQDLMSAGELQSMEWQSLIKAMGPSWREIGKEMGYAEDELTDFRTSLTKGEIDGTEFLEAMVKAATGTGKLAEMAGLSKEQIGSSLTNIQTAFASTGQSIIQTVNDLFEEIEGKTLAEKIQEVGTWVKTDLKPVLNDWVTDNFDDILAFIDRIASYDWTDLLTKVADATEVLFDLYTGIASKLPTSVVAGGMVLASPIGKVFSAFGSLLTGLSKLDLTKLIKFGKSAKSTGDVAEGVSGVTAIVSSLKSIGTAFVGATAFVGVAAELGLVIKEYTSVIQTISDLKIGGNFDRNLKAVAKFMAEAGGITAGLAVVMSAVSGFGLGGAVGVGELLSAGMVGIVAMTGAVIAEYAGVLDEISGLNLNSSRINKNLDAINASMANMQLIMAENGLVAIVAGLGELAAAGIVSVNAKAIDSLIDTLVKISKIGDLDIDWNALEQNSANIKKVIHAMTDGEFWTAWGESDTTGLMSKSVENIGTIFSSWASIIATFKENFGGEDGALEDTSGVTEKIQSNASAINDVIDALVGDDGPITAWAKKRASSNLGKSIENLQSILDTWYDIQDKFKEFKASFETDEGKGDTAAVTSMASTSASITRQVAAVRDVIKTLTDEIGPLKALFQKWTSGNMSDSAGSIEEILSTWQRIQNKFTEFKVIDITAKVNTIMEQFNSVMDAIAGGDTYKSTDENGNTIYSPFAGLNNFIDKMGENIKQGQNQTMLSSMSDAIGYIEDVIDHYSTMQTKMQALTLDPQVVTDVQTMFQNLYDMSNDLHSPDYTGTAGSIESWQLYLDNVYNLVTSVIESSDLLKDGGFSALNTLKTFFSTRLSEFQEAIVTIDRASLDDRLNNIFFMFNQLKSLFNLIRNVEFTDVTEKLNSMKSMLDNQMLGLLTSLISIQAYLNQLGASSSEIPVVTMLSNLFGGLGSAMSGDGFASFNTQLAALAESLDSISLSLYEVNSALAGMQPTVADYVEALDEFLVPDSQDLADSIAGMPALIMLLSDAVMLFRDGQLTLLIQDMEELYGLTVDVSYAYEVDFVYALGYAVAQMTLTQTAVVNLTEAMINLKTSIDECVASLKKFQTELRNTQTQMLQVKQKANELRMAIESIPDHKTITIDVNTNGEVPSFASTGGMISNHGVIYRSKGGFTPKGTDTVPAMLTPGEFVMNTRAVKAMGPSFFRRLNHLDIKGAMVQASRRFGTMAYNVSNVTNHDNHAVVNQYITTNNEQYSYRRARRFVEAL